jgi:hypothetical protein
MLPWSVESTIEEKLGLTKQKFAESKCKVLDSKILKAIRQEANEK